MLIYLFNQQRIYIMFTIFKSISNPVPKQLANLILDEENECLSNAFVPDKSKQNTWLRSSLKIVKCGSVSEGLTTLCSHHERVLRAHTPKKGDSELKDIDEISSNDFKDVTDHQFKWRLILGSLMVTSAVVAGMKIKEATSSLYDDSEHLVKRSLNIGNETDDASINATSSALPLNITESGNYSLNGDYKNITAMNELVIVGNQTNEGANKTDDIKINDYLGKFNLTDQEIMVIYNLSSIQQQKLFRTTVNKTLDVVQFAIKYTESQYILPPEDKESFFIQNITKEYDADDSTDKIKRQLICFKKSSAHNEFKITIKWNDGIKNQSKELLCNKAVLFELPRDVTEFTLCHPLIRAFKLDGCLEISNPLFIFISNNDIVRESFVEKKNEAKWGSTGQRYVHCALKLIQFEQWEGLKRYAEDIINETTLEKAHDLDNIMENYKLMAEKKIAELKNEKVKTFSDTLAAGVAITLASGAVVMVAAGSLIYIMRNQKRQTIKFKNLENLEDVESFELENIEKTLL